MLVEKLITNGALTKRVLVYVPEEKKFNKALKEENKQTLTISVNGVEYDADTTAINYMSSVVSLANFKFNQVIAAGTSPAMSYEAVYKQTVGWKGADNKVHQVQVESIAEALESAMGKVANIVGA